MVQHGSHEARLFNAVDPQNGSIQAELMVCGWEEGGRGDMHIITGLALLMVCIGRT